MAKKKSALDGASRNLLITTVGDILGRAISGLANEGLGLVGGGKDESGKVQLSGDPATKILRALTEEEPQSISDLAEQTGVSLSTLLHALRDAREFNLVEFENDAVRLTDAGRRVARTVKRGGIRQTADRLLGR